MNSKSDVEEGRSRPGVEMDSGAAEDSRSNVTLKTDSVHASGISLSHSQCASQHEALKGISSPCHAVHTDENEGMVIKSIRATDVALGLRRLPVGFCAVVRHNGLEWKTENKRLSTNDGDVEWSASIPIPSDLSASVSLEVFASFEFQPTLGTGELLRRLRFTVQGLLQRNAERVPFNLFPKDGSVVSPCSSVLVTVERQKCDSHRSPVSRALGPCDSTAESQGELEIATNRGHQALLHYQRQGQKRDLECSVREFEWVLSVCPPGHPCRAAVHANLAMATFLSCQVENMDVPLEVPRRLYCEALSARPVGHPDRPATLIQLASVHFVRFWKQRDEIGGKRIGALLAEAMQLSSTDSHEHRAAAFILQLCAAHRMGPVQAVRQSSIEEASAARSTGLDLWALSVQLLDRFQQLGDLADLQQAIIILEKLVRATSFRNHQYRAVLANLGMALSYRFKQLGDLKDLEDGILKQKHANDLTPLGHPDKPIHLNTLSGSFFARFHRLGELSDLENAISILRDAIDLTPDGHSVKPAWLNNLGISLKSRFQCLGEPSDIENALSALSNAIDLTPHGHPDRPSYLSNFGSALQVRFNRFGKLHDLEDAISALWDVVNLIPHDHPDKYAHLDTLGTSFMARFQRLGEPSDLDNAISIFGDAIVLTPRGHPDKPRHLNNLGSCFSARFQRFGKRCDLESAVSMIGNAVELTPHGHADECRYLGNLGGAFLTRFEHLREPSDLGNAIIALGDAADLIPQGHPDKPRILSNLGVSFNARFQRLGELNDLENAISALKDAVDLTPLDHPSKPIYLNNLGSSFFDRFRRVGELSDLENTILALRNVIELTPRDHPNKPHILRNLGLALKVRFEYLGELVDLEATFSNVRDAVHLTPHGHPDKPGYLSDLGDYFNIRFERFGDPRDLQHAILLYSHAASTPIGPVSVRFRASQNWISCARRISHRSLLHAYSVAIALLPRLAWVGLPLRHRYLELKRGADVVREAAAAALDSGLPETAVEWLEQGRSIVWGELLQLRSSYEDLSFAYPEHARRLRELSTALEEAGATREKMSSALLEESTTSLQDLLSGTGWRPDTTGKTSLCTLVGQIAHHTDELLQQGTDRLRTLAIKRDDLLHEIRRLPGFERYLLRKEFDQLRAASHTGPVVILNAAESRCDALVILANVDHAIHVPLPNITLNLCAGLQHTLRRLVRHARAVRYGQRVPLEGVSWESFLPPLWRCVVKPVLDALAFSSPGDLSRIFWCPTGPFTFLPIHAAGFYDSEHSQLGHKVYDFVVSSYVPTLSTLVLSRNPTTPSNSVRFLAVRQPPSDGQSRLPGVHTEIERTKDIIKDSASTCVTLLETSTGTVEEVLALMKESDWVHFACHGIQDAKDPAGSGLCLADQRRLKVSDIIALSRPRGGLAFLSACQTAKGDEDLSDEAIHIAAGMLFAGYGGVVGTMWSISDEVAPDVAEDVYRQLLGTDMRRDYRDAARALHGAIERLRESGRVSFDEWLPFIHVGL